MYMLSDTFDVFLCMKLLLEVHVGPGVYEINSYPESL